MKMTSGKSSFCILDPPGYIDPAQQDMLITDITAEDFLDVEEQLIFEEIPTATSFPGTFPVDGIIYGRNNRLMVSLPCRQRGSATEAINVIFLINPTSPCSYLSAKTMKALIGNTDKPLLGSMYAMIHSDIVLQCYMSPPDKHFADINVLGADFLVQNHVTLKVNYGMKTCTLMVEKDE